MGIHRKAALLAGTGLALVLGGQAVANDQTEAGTKVGNTFTLDYSVNGTPQTQITNATGTFDSDGVDTGATTFVVDRRIDVDVTATSGASSNNTTVAAGGSDGALTFTVTNEGNDNQRFRLQPSDLSGNLSGNFTVTYYIDDGDGTFEPGTATGQDGSAITYDDGAPNGFPELAPGEKLFVVVSGGTVPGSATNGTTYDVGLAATAYTPTAYINGGTVASPAVAEAADSDGNDVGAAENVFADAAGDGVAASGDAAEDGRHSAKGTYTVAAAQLSGTKDVYVLNQDGSACPAATPTRPTSNVGGSYAVPGACVAYVITVANGGGATASDIDVADDLPVGITFQDAALFGTFNPAAPDTNPAALTKAGASCAATAAGDCVVRMDNGDLEAGETGYLVIWARINGTVN